jgi:prevent-host-death family protein
VAKLVNLYEAKTHLSSLVEEVAAGEEVVIAKAGRPMARLVPLQPASAPRLPGGWEGKVSISDDFDDSLDPEDLAAWYETSVEPA